MEKIELFEKLVNVQEMHIELMKDFANLQGGLKTLEEVKNRRVADLKIEIVHQDEKIAALEVENEELKKQIEKLKQQYEELQKSLVSVEAPKEENQ